MVGMASVLRNALVCDVVGKPPKLICAYDVRNNVAIRIVEINLRLCMTIICSWYLLFFVAILFLCKDKSKMLDLKKLSG